MEFKLPAEVQTIFKTFSEAGFKIHLVGGSVRDLLLGRSVKDWDFTTDATPDQILKLFPAGYYNNKFGTVGVQMIDDRLQTSDVFEITTMRKEGDYKNSRHPEEVSWTDKIDEDLARRDFTINAIALDGQNEIVDPYNGREDLEKKQIKAVGDPQKRFREDALRLMRAIRFASQLDFTLEPKTFDAILQNASQIENISWERIRDELLKILSTDRAYEGITLLREAGLLQFILPEVERCFGIKQEGPKHDRKYDIGTHLLLSLKNCPSPDPIVRFATLIHDIGKPDTQSIQEDGNVTFYGHDIVGGKIAKALGHRLRFSKKDSDKIGKLVRYHMFTLDEHQTDSAIRRFIRNIGLENVDDMMAVRVGDRLGGGTDTAVSWRMKQFRQRIDDVMTKPFSVTDLKINGQDVMKALQIPPSRKVGEVLDTLFKEVQDDSSKNNPEYLLNRLKEIS